MALDAWSLENSEMRKNHKLTKLLKGAMSDWEVILWDHVPKIYPLVNIQKAIEHGPNRNRWFTS